MDSYKKLLFILVVLFLVNLACGFGVDEEPASPPTAEIVLPTASDSFGVGQIVNVVVTATSEIGIERIDLLVNGQVILSEDIPNAPTTKSLNFEWVPAAEGAVVLAVIAYDTEGNDSEAGMVTIQIVGGGSGGSGEPGEQPATATESGAQQTIVCTPPPCGANEAYFCPGSCPGGCGIQCATFTPTNPPPSTATFTPLPPTNTFTPSPTNTTEWVVPSIQIVVSLQILQLATVETVYEQVSIPSGSTANTAATCPANSVVVSGGYAASPDVYVYNHHKNGNGWGAYAMNNAGASKPLTVYARCLKNTNGTTQEVYQITHVGAGTYGNVSVSCPAGTVVTGGGFVSNHTGDARVYNSAMYGNGWRAWANNTGTTSRQVNVYAVCLSGVSVSVTQRNENIFIPAGDTNGGDAECQEGELAVGGGFVAQMEFYMFNTSPRYGSTTDWSGYAYNPTSEEKNIIVYAVCMSWD